MNFKKYALIFLVLIGLCASSFALGAADLAITVREPREAPIGEPARMRFTIQNLGTTIAKRVKVKLTLPDLTDVDYPQKKCTLEPKESNADTILQCSLGKIKPNKKANIPLTLTILSPHSLRRYSAEVSSATVDDNPGNDTVNGQLSLPKTPSVLLQAGDRVELHYCTEPNIPTISQCGQDGFIVSNTLVTLQADGTVLYPYYYPHEVRWAQTNATQVTLQMRLREVDPVHETTLNARNFFCLEGTMVWQGYDGLFTAYEICKYLW